MVWHFVSFLPYPPVGGCWLSSQRHCIVSDPRMQLVIHRVTLLALMLATFKLHPFFHQDFLSARVLWVWHWTKQMQISACLSPSPCWCSMAEASLLPVPGFYHHHDFVPCVTAWVLSPPVHQLTYDTFLIQGPAHPRSPSWIAAHWQSP